MARLFDDSLSQRLEVNAPAITGAPLTMACWFNSNDDAAHQTMMIVCDYSGTHAHWFHIRGDMAGDYLYGTSVGTGGYASAGTTTGYLANTWHHGAFVVESDSYRWVRIDGGNEGTDSTDSQVQNLDYTCIGVLEYSSGTYEDYFSGAIAYPAIWNVALTDLEVADLARGVHPLLIRPANIIYWPLEDNDNGWNRRYDLTPVNGPGWTGGPPQVMPLKKQLWKGPMLREARKIWAVS